MIQRAEQTTFSINPGNPERHRNKTVPGANPGLVRDPFRGTKIALQFDVIGNGGGKVAAAQMIPAGRGQSNQDDDRHWLENGNTIKRF